MCFHRLEDLGLAAPLPQLLPRQTRKGVPAVGRDVQNVVELTGVLERTGPQQDGVDDAEDGGVGGDRKSERQHREEDDRRLRSEPAHCAADVLHDAGERDDSAAVPD